MSLYCKRPPATLSHTCRLVSGRFEIQTCTPPYQSGLTKHDSWASSVTPLHVDQTNNPRAEKCWSLGVRFEESSATDLQQLFFGYAFKCLLSVQHKNVVKLHLNGCNIDEISEAYNERAPLGKGAAVKKLQVGVIQDQACERKIRPGSVQ